MKLRCRFLAAHGYSDAAALRKQRRNSTVALVEHAPSDYLAITVGGEIKRIYEHQRLACTEAIIRLD